MSVRTLVRRDALDPYRSRSLWIILGAFVFVFGLIGYLLGSSQATEISSVVALVMGALAPVAALGMTYESIAGPRQSGSLRVLLSYPYSRRDLVLGTLLGRLIVIWLAVTVGILAAGVSTFVFGGTVDAGGLLEVLAYSLLLSTSAVGVGLGISTSVASSNRAAILAAGTYLMFVAFWGLVPTVIRYLLNGFSFALQGTPDWVVFWNQLNPMTAFQRLAETTSTAPEAFYQEPWFWALVLVAWFVVPLGFGLLKFERADL